MKFRFLSFAIIVSLAIVSVSFAQGYNYGDYRSATLTDKAWKALKANDIEAVLAYTNKCIELYASDAKKMQASLKEYPKGASEGGSNEEVFEYWALNDVGTCLFIQGEAYRKADMLEEAKESYNTLIKDYKFSQCWDQQGWFWRPAEAAQEKLDMLLAGRVFDFGNNSSATLRDKAWKALNEKDYEGAIVYANKCISVYKDKAKEMQDSLTEYPWRNNDEIFSYWALNDVGTCLLIKGQAQEALGKKDEAKETFKELIDKYYFAQTWDPQGFFWKPAEAAKERLNSPDSRKASVKANGTFVPFAVYIDKASKENHFYASGWMGDAGDVDYNESSTEYPHSGDTCIKVVYSAKGTSGQRWAGIYWQNPANNWGSKDGGFDLTGAKQLTFWARGQKGGERIEEFKLGGLTGDYPDSDAAGIGPVILTPEWKQYKIDLRGKDLSYISGGFCWATNADVNPKGATFYLDDIIYE
jgi:tetratricopeptide (TPR) repeat protein